MAAAGPMFHPPPAAVVGNAPPPFLSSWQREHPKTYHQDRPRRDNLHQHGGVPEVKVARQRDVPLRHPKVTEQLFEQLQIVFPEKDQEEKIREVLRNHNTETDLNRLTNYCMSALFLWVISSWRVLHNMKAYNLAPAITFCLPWRWRYMSKRIPLLWYELIILKASIQFEKNIITLYLGYH